MAHCRFDGHVRAEIDPIFVGQNDIDYSRLRVLVFRCNKMIQHTTKSKKCTSWVRDLILGGCVCEVEYHATCGIIMEKNRRNSPDS